MWYLGVLILMVVGLVWCMISMLIDELAAIFRGERR